jgi:hypothetical protein
MPPVHKRLHIHLDTTTPLFSHPRGCGQVAHEGITHKCLHDQREQSRLEGKLRGATIRVAPYHFALYSSIRRKVPHPTSATDRESQPRESPRTLKSSTTMTGLVLASRVVCLCRKSRRRFFIFRWSLASLRAAFLLLFEPFCLRESCLERRLRSLSFFASGLGGSILVPSERAAKEERPKSTPTTSSSLLTSLGLGSGRSTSQVRLT